MCCMQKWDGKTKELILWALRDKGKNCLSGNDAEFGGFGILVKEEKSASVVEVTRKNVRIMAIVLALDKDMMQLICAYGPQSGRSDTDKARFYDEMVSE